MQQLGMTSAGSPYFRLNRSLSDVYIAELDLAGGGQLRNVSRFTDSHLGTNRLPTWSPDGTRVAFLSVRGVYGEAPHLVIQTVETGEDRVYPLPFALGQSSRAEWSSDGMAV